MEYTKAESKEASKAQFRGVWAAITTPFHADGSVDLDGLRTIMRHLTDTLSIDGVFCTGTMGEFWSLTREERKQAVEVVVEAARGKCRVIAHTAHHSVAETIDLTRHAQEVGADFAILINPYFPHCDDPMIYRWYEEVCAAVDIGVWMFDTAYANYGLSAEVTAAVARIENICGIKIVRDPAHYDEVKRLTGGSIVMSDPNEDRWLSLVRDKHQQVFMSSPHPYCLQTATSQPLRQYSELALAGRFEEAEKVSATMDEARRVYKKWIDEPWVSRHVIPNAYLKAWMELIGLPGGPVRAPFVEITDAEREEMRSDLEKLGLLGQARAAVGSPS